MALSIPSKTSIVFLPLGQQSQQIVLGDDAWAKLPTKTRERIARKMAVLDAIRLQAGRADASVVQTLCELQARRMCERGFSADRLYADYYNYLKKGWRGLFHGQLNVERTRISPESAEFIWGWMQTNKRSSKQGFRDFIEKHWRAGFQVPGVPVTGQLGTWKDWFRFKWPLRELPLECPTDLPRGWKYDNLMRPCHKPSKSELLASRQGVSAALSALPSIPGTRADMRWLEFVTIDDVKLDFRIHVPGIGKPVDLVCLVVMDISTGVILGVGFRPVLLREDGSGEKLKLRDTKAMIVRLLTNHGIPPYGMTLILENGTATVDEAFEQALRDAVGDLVRISHASMLGGTVWDGGFADRAVGNSKSKAWLESFFNPMHNALASLPGQTGRRYDVAPQDDHGRRKELAMLVKAEKFLCLAERLVLRKPYLSLEEAEQELWEVFHALHRSREHRLEGFSKVLAWRFSEGEPWRIWDIEPPPPAAVDVILTDSVNETKLERAARLADGVVCMTLAPSCVPALLETQKVITFEKGEVQFTWEERRYRFTPYTPENIAVLDMLAERGEGCKALAYFDATDPSAMYVRDEKGVWLGMLHQTGKLSRHDREGVKAAIATKKRLLAATIEKVNKRSPEVAAQREEDIAHNLEVVQRAAQDHQVTIIAPGTTTQLPTSHVHIQLAQAATAHLASKKSAAAQVREDEHLNARADAAIAGMAPEPTTTPEDEDDGL